MELDLPIALALLAAQGVIAPSTIKSTAFSGEISLDGSVVNSPKNDQLIISKEINDREKLKINSIFNSNGLHLKKNTEYSSNKFTSRKHDFVSE